MSHALDKLTIKGFKSIRSLEDFELKNLNVLIGANGAGKSNFVELFHLLRAMADESLQKFVTEHGEHGTPDGFFFMGPKYTRNISIHLEFGPDVYEFKLAPTSSNVLMIEQEEIHHLGGIKSGGSTYSMSKGSQESVLKQSNDIESTKGKWFHLLGVNIYESIANWTVYHFHDTSMLAPLRRTGSVRNNDFLLPDAGNLAAFLMMLHDEYQNTYEQIRDAVRLVTPFFNDFKFRPKASNGDETIQLEWTQKSSSYPFLVSQFSDGTLRFIALATALLQPDPPSTIIIDEPELGLHPFAIDILAELIEATSKQTQVIISTQSPALVDCFAAENIIVVNRKDGASCFERLDQKNLSSWLEDYSLGELWRKNVIDGGPTHE